MERVKNKLYANITIIGLENNKKIGADKTLKIKSTCTNKTDLTIKILES